ncbi:hypothetical protein XSR1_40044 [Xenorhabdus szentirmaii DSM 16338]|uniref:Uncharacterized protein n=1 Tax=Xenorhabdus szentirmaii DSM 16338 TaxID=1427518 RepID=W1IZX6_9GAMM|nr:hypothetical protein XSR1_40044 [Xenorhabdus szentirmaii DSM 16338]
MYLVATFKSSLPQRFTDREIGIAADDHNAKEDINPHSFTQL